MVTRHGFSQVTVNNITNGRNEIVKVSSRLYEMGQEEKRGYRKELDLQPLNVEEYRI